jgi:hypothetical protein
MVYVFGAEIYIIFPFCFEEYQFKLFCMQPVFSTVTPLRGGASSQDLLEKYSKPANGYHCNIISNLIHAQVMLYL